MTYTKQVTQTHKKGLTPKPSLQNISDLLRSKKFNISEKGLANSCTSERNAEWYLQEGYTRAFRGYVLDAQVFFDRACILGDKDHKYLSVRSEFSDLITAKLFNSKANQASKYNSLLEKVGDSCGECCCECCCMEACESLCDGCDCG